MFKFEDNEEGRSTEGTIENAEERAVFIIEERWRWWRPRVGEGGTGEFGVIAVEVRRDGPGVSPEDGRTLSFALKLRNTIVGEGECEVSRGEDREKEGRGPHGRKGRAKRKLQRTSQLPRILHPVSSRRLPSYGCKRCNECSGESRKIVSLRNVGKRGSERGGQRYTRG